MAAYLYSDGFTLGFLPCRQFETPELQHSRAICQIDTFVLYAHHPTVMESYISAFRIQPGVRSNPKEHPNFFAQV